MHFDINPLCDSLKRKQLRSLSRRDLFYLLKEITEGVLGQVLGCDVREHLLGRRVVKGDLALLDKLAHEEVPKGDMLGPGTEHAISRNAECSTVDCAVRDCVFDPKLIGAPPRKNRYPVVD